MSFRYFSKSTPLLICPRRLRRRGYYKTITVFHEKPTTVLIMKQHNYCLINRVAGRHGITINKKKKKKNVDWHLNITETV